jgi:hypothetical protein
MIKYAISNFVKYITVVIILVMSSVYNQNKGNGKEILDDIMIYNQL